MSFINNNNISMPRLKETTRRLKQKTLTNLYLKKQGNQVEMAKELGITKQAINQRIHNKTIDVSTRLIDFLDQQGFTVETYMAIIISKLNQVNSKDHAKYCALFQEMIPGLKAPQKVEQSNTHQFRPTEQEQEEYARLKEDIAQEVAQIEGIRESLGVVREQEVLGEREQSSPQTLVSSGK